MLQNNFLVRSLSALVLAPLALAAVYFGAYAFMALLVLIALAMAWEWSKLHGLSATFPLTIFLMIGSGSIVMLAGQGEPGWALWSLLVFAAILFLLSLKTRKHFSMLSHRFYWAGVLYIGLPLIAFAWIRLHHPEGAMLSFWILFVIWAMDSGAYFSGKLLGGPKLWPAVSPKKTWSGLLGGASIAGFAALIAGKALAIESLPEYFILGFVTGFLSQGGDLLESAIKRKAGVKDSSSLIPGHGGIMDRVDGLGAGLCFIALVLLFIERF